jgi:hypothetical protein
MQFRRPDIGSFNCLFVASRERFRRNMGFVKHLLLSPESPAVDEIAHPNSRRICLEKCRAMRHRQSAELLLRPQGEGLASRTIPELSYLRQQENLKALSLIIPRCAPLLGSASTTLMSNKPGDPWPRLEMLYLRVGDQHRLEQFPKFAKLQILGLQSCAPGVHTIGRNAIEKIAKCRHPRAIDIVLHELDDIKALLNKFNGYPSIENTGYGGTGAAGPS